MNQSWRACAWALLALLTPFGCAGTETGNPPRPVVSLRMTSSDPDQVSLAQEGKGALVAHARLGVERLSFEECESSDRIDSQASGLVDLTAEPREFELPASTLCFVELVLSARDVQWAEIRSGANPPLSFGIAGAIPGDVPFFVEDSQSISVVFRPQVLNLSPDSRLSLVIDVARLLEYEELVQLPPNQDGDVLIGEQDNTFALDGVRGRWATSWELYSSEGDGAPTLIARGEQQ